MSNRLQRVPCLRRMSVIAGALLFFLLGHAVHADDSASPHREPDVRAWQSDRESGQKALEAKNNSAAEKYFKAALAEAENFDHDDYRIAESLTDLGILYARMGNYAASEPLMQRAVVISKEDPHPELEAKCNLILGIVCRKLGHHDDSEKAFLHAEEVMKRRFRPDHPVVIHIEYQQALLYADEGDFEKAEPLLKRCVKLFENPISETSASKGDPASIGIETFVFDYKPNYAAALEGLSRLAVLYLHQKRPADAEACMKDSLKLVDNYTAKDDPYLIATLKELGNFYVTTSNYIAAEPITKRLVKVEEKKLSATNESTLTAQISLVAVYSLEKKPADALELGEKLIPLTDQVFGPSHRLSIYLITDLSNIYLKQKQYDKAESLLRNQLEKVEKSGADSQAVLSLLHMQQHLYTAMDRKTDLVRACQREIEIHEKMVGPDSAKMLPVLWECAVQLHIGNCPTEAAQLEARVKAINAAHSDWHPPNNF